ncbi:MAG TPA: helix-turn-helix transcriptional regulator [Dehalococcoidia bacterium]|nr:transcriptional regulator [Chloroflexota bacterium]HCV28241.1 transcriptional regulator [Dehalococcoidia bacterium]HJM52928.1 helix-turn-helix transcriptional regulator [Dehalococcoidia bacterium]
MKSLKTVTKPTTAWKDVSVSEFLGLTEQERQYVELKLILKNLLRTNRSEVELTQEQLAKRMNSSQSRVAKMEAGDPAVSIDLFVKALFQTGTTSKRLGTVIAESRLACG